MLDSFWDTFQIILYGFYITFGEVEFVTRLRRWWNKQPQIEEQLAQHAMDEAPHKKGYTCIITGANSGVGKETAFYMATTGYHVIMASRSKQLAESAIAEISKRAASKGIEANVEFIPLDLSDQANIHQFVRLIQKRDLKIDLLVNNAGVMWVPKSLTKEGIEMHFGVVSYYLYKDWTSNTEITKTMPIFLQFLYKSVGQFIFKTAFQGACCTIYAALSQELDQKTGLFLFEGKIQKNVRSDKKYDEERERLWRLTEELASIKYPF